jgi:ribosome maturation factor RimP
MGSLDEITPVVESKLTQMGFELFDLRLFHAGSRSILRITIDSPKGVTVGDCERVSNELSVILDVENFSPDRRYNLEISSPGIDRPLKSERDYRRITGRSVVVHLTEAVEGKKTLTGEVVKCEDNKLTLKIENKEVIIELSNIYSGKEEIRFK